MSALQFVICHILKTNLPLFPLHKLTLFFVMCGEARADITDASCYGNPGRPWGRNWLVRQMLDILFSQVFVLVVVATVEAIVVIDLMMMTMMESRWKGNGLLLPPQLERIVTLL